MDRGAPRTRTKDDGAEAPWTFLGVVVPTILFDIVATSIIIVCSSPFLYWLAEATRLRHGTGRVCCVLSLWSYRCGTKCYIFLRIGCHDWWRKKYDYSETAHFANIGQYWPTSPLLCTELDTITYNRLHKESTEPKFGMHHPFVSKLCTSGAWLNSVVFAEFSAGDLVTNICSRLRKILVKCTIQTLY